jgi:hypothetical protein
MPVKLFQPVEISFEAIKNFVVPHSNEPKPTRYRFTGDIRNEYERVKGGLDSIRGLLRNAKQRLEVANNVLKNDEYRLQELLAAGFSRKSPEVQALTGSDFPGGRFHGDVGHQEGSLERAKRIIKECEPRIAELKKSVEREEKRIKPILKALEAEFEQSRKIENLSNPSHPIHQQPIEKNDVAPSGQVVFK